MKNRRIANLTLASVAVSFIVVLIIRHGYYDNLLLKCLYIVLEAALVGGIADWFAVTALFEKPLGFPYHTAIIPKNREKIIESVTVMVENELLSKESLKERMAKIHFVRWMITEAQEHGGKEMVAKRVVGYIHKMILSINPAEAAQTIEKFLKDKCRAGYLADRLGWLLNLLLTKGGADKGINWILDEAIQSVATDKAREFIEERLEQAVNKEADNILKRVFKSVLEAADAVNIADAAKELQQCALVELSSMREAEHPIRLFVRAKLGELPERLETDETLKSTIEKWQIGLADRIELENILRQLIELVLAGERGSHHDAVKLRIEAWLHKQVAKYWAVFKVDYELQDWLEKYVQEAIQAVIQSEHQLVGKITRNALSILKDEKLAKFIDDKAGEDLQWIRINGSVVGGLVGLCIFLFLHFIYDPYAVPFLRGLVG